MAASDKTVCAITAAMQHGTGLDQFAADFPSRFFDVGIAEATQSAWLRDLPNRE